jgi:hypothetical protein
MNDRAIREEILNGERLIKRHAPWAHDGSGEATLTTPAGHALMGKLGDLRKVREAVRDIQSSTNPRNRLHTTLGIEKNPVAIRALDEVTELYGTGKPTVFTVRLHF